MLTRAHAYNYTVLRTTATRFVLLLFVGKYKTIYFYPLPRRKNPTPSVVRMEIGDFITP